MYIPLHFISKPTAMTTEYSAEKENGSGSNWYSAGAKVPKFFKIVSNPELHRLRLPTEFTRRYGHNLPDFVSLKVPSGLVWKVELIRSDCETWLHRGWQQFEEYYSIGFGHFLLFEYVGNSHFEVHIFDTTATEIEYFHYDSLDRDSGGNQVAETEGVESESDDSVIFLKEIFTWKNIGSKDQDAVEIIGDNPPSRCEKKRRMQESDDLHSEKLRKSSRGEQNSSTPVKKESRFMASTPNYRSDIDESGEGAKLRYSDRKQVQQQARDVNNRFKAYTRALVFMSRKPTRKPFSIVVMHPSYVSTRRSTLNIPRAFAKEILPGKGSCSIRLVSEGKIWLVRYIYGKEGASLTSGWRKFSKDNDLKVGDACMFEVSERINLAWNVIIFRG